MKKHVAASAIMLMASVMCGTLPGQVSTTAPPPNRNVTAAQRKAQPPATPQKQFPGARATAPIPAPGAGTVEGFVFWPTNSIAHKPLSSCSGLAITVSVGSSNGPFTAYTPMATLSNNFKYVGQVKEVLSATQTDLFDVCTYGYSHVPVGPDLQVKITITQPTAFTPVVTPQFSVIGPVKIVNGQCNMLPNVASPSPSDMLAHWGSCQNMAYNVNFILWHPQMLHSVGTNGGPGSSGGSVPQGGMLSRGAQQGMLSSAPPKGMLASGTVSAVQQPATPGMLNGGTQPSPAQSGARLNPGSKSQTNPPLPSRQKMTNLDVINMLRAGVPDSTIIRSLGSANHNFDFSLSGCRALQQAHASRAILDAMGDGSVRPCFTGGVHAGTGL